MTNIYGGGTSGLSNLTGTPSIKSAPQPAASNPAVAPAAAWHAPQSSNGAFWVGGDGNVYVKGSQGTNSAGKADGNTTNYWQSRGYGLINDPSATAAAPGNPTGAGGGGGGSQYTDKSNDITLQNAALGSNDANTQAGIDSINKSLATLLGNYDTEAATNKTSHVNSSNDNQNQLQTGKQTALTNAAAGRQGLIGTLSGIGALSGDSLTKANNAVQAGANEDLTGASNTFATNQSGIDNAYNVFTDADKRRRDDANVQASNSVLNARNDGLSAKQKIFAALAGDYASQGDAGRAKSYTDQAASLYPQIASTNIANSTITPQAAAYTPATLASYLNKSRTVVNTSAPTSNNPTSISSIPGLSATTKKQLA